MNFQLGMKISNCPYNGHFFPAWDKILILCTRVFPVLFKKKIKMTTSQARFKWTDDKLINLIKCLQEFQSSMEFRNCDSNSGKLKINFLLSFNTNENLHPE